MRRIFLFSAFFYDQTGCLKKWNNRLFSIKRGCVVIECYDAAFVFSALSFFLSLSRRILLIFP